MLSRTCDPDTQLLSVEYDGASYDLITYWDRGLRLYAPASGAGDPSPNLAYAAEEAARTACRERAA